jgi:hypothetical protein
MATPTSTQFTIQMTVTLPNQAPIQIPNPPQVINTDTSSSVTVMVPPSSQLSCFRIEAGLKSLLKFFLLNPVIQPPPSTTPAAGQQAPAAPPATPATDPLAGFWFSTADASGYTGQIPLTSAAVYMDNNSLSTLFGPNQTELQKINFYNPTGKCVNVTIIVGRNMGCCDMPIPVTPVKPC